MEILVVDDSAADAYLTREALLRAIPTCHVHVVYDGKHALAYLHRVGTHASSTRPNLIVLDLNMPGIDGFDVLAALKATREFDDIPIVVLSTSDLISDQTRAYALGAHYYLCKPLDLDAYLLLGYSIAELWDRRLPDPSARSGYSG